MGVLLPTRCKVSVDRRCRIKRAIIDKNVEIPAEMTVGYDLEDETTAASTSPREAWW